MTPEQISLVQISFKTKVWPVANEAALLFYNRLFELDPSLKALFNPDMSEQWRKLMEMLWLVVHGLSEMDELEILLESLGERHVYYGVRPEYYPLVEEALLWMIESCMEQEFTSEANVAWRNVYGLMSGVMKQVN